MIAGICTFPRLPCPSTTLHVMLNLTSATSTGVCHTGTLALYVCSLLLWLTTNNTTTTHSTWVYCCSWRNDEKKVVFGCSSSRSALLFYCCCSCWCWWCCFLLYVIFIYFSFSVWWDIPFGIFSSFCFSTAAAAAAAAAVGCAASFCTYSLEKLLFHFPFDEIYRRLIFSLSGVLFPRE